MNKFTKFGKSFFVLIVLALIASCSVNTVDQQLESDNGSVTTQWQFNTQTWANEGTKSGLSFETGTGSGGWGNGELQYYQSANATESGGILTITAKKESVGGMAYTSARANGGTLSGNGRVEARIQVPAGQGFWPAFWLLGSGTWPGCGEIDIMETVNSANTLSSTCHWDEGGHASYGASVGCGMTSYHVYTTERDATYIKSYVDGSLFYTINITTAGTTELKNNMHIIVNLAVGGSWPGSPNSSTPFPSAMNIDYMRIYGSSSSSTSSSSSSSSSSSTSTSSSSSSSSSSTSTSSGAISLPGVISANVGAIANGSSKSWTVNCTSAGNYRIRSTATGTAPNFSITLTFNGRTTALSMAPGQVVPLDTANVPAGNNTVTIKATTAGVSIGLLEAVKY